MRRLPLTIICLLTLTSCSVLDKLTAKDGIVGDVAVRLKDAIEDIDPQGITKGKLCSMYKSKGRGLAEAAWTMDWPKFAPMFSTPPDPAADITFCHGLIMQAGAEVVTKKSDSGSASAICMQAQFPQDFHKKSLAERAAITCHEAVHIVEQDRVGCTDWIATYLATISGRLTFEGTAYSLMRKLLVRYGYSEEDARRQIAKRAARFPKTYSIPESIITDTCTMEHWDGIYDALKERTKS